MNDEDRETTAALYDEYENSLMALEAIPGIMTDRFTDARRDCSTCIKAADTSFRQRALRLTSLLTSAQSRYNIAIDTLNQYDVLLPAQIRAENGQSGDDKSLERAVAEHISAIATIEAKSRELLSAAARSKDSSIKRAQTAQKATAALHARQQKLHLEKASREPVMDAARKASARRRRVLFGMCIGGAMLALVIALLVSSLNS